MKITPKKDLYNAGLCFTKGKIYEANVNSLPALMDKQIINDMGENHLIGSWWREFKEVKIK